MKNGILIVDDALFMRTVLRNILETADYTVAGEAADGLQGLKQFKSLKPDLVTLDIIMPGMSGIDVLKKILAKEPGAAILMISALGQERLMAEALKIGAKGFLVKPFKDVAVLKEVRRIMGSTGAKAPRAEG